MQKINSLYTYLIQELPGYRKRLGDIHVYAENGKTISYPGNTNSNFKLAYTAVIFLENCQYTAAQVSYVVMQWLDQNETSPADNERLKWHAEILSKNNVEIMLYIDLTEIIKVGDIDGSTTLTTANEFKHEQPSSPDLSVDIEHNPQGNPANQQHSGG